MAIFTFLGGIPRDTLPEGHVYEFLIFSRVGVGFMAAGATMTTNTLLAESCPARSRGRMSVIMHIFWPCGILVAVQIIQELTGEQWRTLMLASGAPGIILAPIVACTMWESPRFLLIKNRKPEAIRTVVAIAVANYSSLDSLPSQWTLKDIEAPPEAVGASEVFKSDFLCPVTIPLWICFFAINYAGKGITLWLPKYMGEAGFADSRIHDMYRAIGIGQIVAIVLALLFIDQGERRFTLAVSYLGAGCCLLAAIAVPGMTHNHQFGLIVMTLFFEELIWCALYIIAGEAYPSVIRNSAAGLAMGPNRIGGVISASIGGYLMHMEPIDGLPVPPVAYHFLGCTGVFFVASIAAYMISIDMTRKALVDQVSTPRQH